MRVKEKDGGSLVSLSCFAVVGKHFYVIGKFNFTENHIFVLFFEHNVPRTFAKVNSRN